MKGRFELKSYNFKDLRIILYDHLNKEELNLTLYELIELLNKETQQEYDFRKLGDEINIKLKNLMEKYR